MFGWSNLGSMGKRKKNMGEKMNEKGVYYFEGEWGGKIGGV